MQIYQVGEVEGMQFMALEYFEGRNSDAVNAFSGWYCLAFHNNVLAQRLSEKIA